MRLQRANMGTQAFKDALNSYEGGMNDLSAEKVIKEGRDKGMDRNAIVALLIEEYGMTFDNAEKALDRFMGNFTDEDLRMDGYTFKSQGKMDGYKSEKAKVMKQLLNGQISQDKKKSELEEIGKYWQG